MTTGKALNGKPYAGNPHVRFDEGEVASAAMPRRGSLLYKEEMSMFAKREKSGWGVSVVMWMCLGAASLPSSAADRYWTGGGETLGMDEAANWGGTAPGTSDTAIVKGNLELAPATVPGGETSYAFLVLGDTGSAVPSVATEGFVLQTNGVMNVTGADGLRVGRLTGNTGTYMITNGTLNALNSAAFVGICGAKGLLKIDGDGVVNVNILTLASKGPFESTQKSEAYLEIGGNGRLNLKSEMRVSAQSGGKGYYAKVTQTGGTVTVASTVNIGYSSTGDYVMSGGQLNLTGTGKYFIVGGSDEGTFVQSGGAVTLPTKSIPYLGYNANVSGTYIMTGGTFETATEGFLVGNKGTGLLDVSGTAVMTIKGNLNLGFAAGGRGTLKLHDGGKIIANHVKPYQGEAVLAQFDGGTLRARQKDDILKNLSNIELKAGGLAIETAGFDLTVVNSKFNATPGGKISVTGGGTLTFDSATTLSLTEKPNASYVFAETDGVFSGMPTLAAGSGARMRMSADRRRIYIVRPGTMIIVR